MCYEERYILHICGIGRHLFYQGVSIKCQIRRYWMEHVEYFLSIMQYATDTREKRHIVGGMLLSISLLFGGMAFTVMTMKSEEKCDE